MTPSLLLKGVLSASLLLLLRVQHVLRPLLIYLISPLHLIEMCQSYHQIK